MTELEILGANIKRYRLAKRLRQADLTANVGLTSDTICRIERGRQENIGLKYLISICRELNLELFQLFLENPDMLFIKFVVSDQNLRSFERLLNKFFKKGGGSECRIILS